MAQKEIEPSQQLLDQTGQKRDLSVVPQIRPIDIKNDIARSSSALDKMDIPALGMRFKAELERTRELLNASKDAVSLDKAKERIERLSGFFKAESGILGNVPSELPRRLTLEKIIDAIDSTLGDPVRAKSVLEAASLYIAHAGRYNAERAERDALFDFMVDKGAAAGSPYNRLDEGILRSFQANALIMEDNEKKLVAAWRKEEYRANCPL